MKGRRHTFADFIAERQVTAPHLNMRLAVFVRSQLLIHRHRVRFQRIELFPEVGQLRPLRCKFCCDFPDIVIRDLGLLRRIALPIGNGHCSGEIRRHLEHLLHSGITGRAETKMTEDMIIMRRLLFQADAQFRSRWQIDGCPCHQGQ